MVAKKVPPAASARFPEDTIEHPPPRPPATRQAATAPLPSLAPPTTTDPATLWQAVHDAIMNAFEQANQSLDVTKDKVKRKTLNQLIGTLSEELTALNQEDIRDRTISLQAASLQLGSGIDRLKDLRQQVDSIADALANASKIVGAIDGVLGGLSSLLAVFPVA